MPSAARSPVVGCASASAAGSPASMRSTGSGSMITPVENGSTCSGAQPSCARQRDAGGARARQAVLAGAGVGVAGVDHQARMPQPRGQVLAAHLHRRGAEAVLREHAGRPRAPSSISTTVRSLRLALRMPASATPSATPGTGKQRGRDQGHAEIDGHAAVLHGDIAGCVRSTCRGSACTSCRDAARARIVAADLRERRGAGTTGRRRAPARPMLASSTRRPRPRRSRSARCR